MEKTYPIIQIYPTIQGQGYRTGENITLVRSGHSLDLQYVYLKPVREAPITLMTEKEIIAECVRHRNTQVFFGGEDPAFLDPNQLFKGLQKMGFKTWVDTCGMISLKNIDHLSLGPKPGLPVDQYMLKEAQDVRFYWDHDPIWEENINRCLPYIHGIIQIIPRRMDLDCIQGTMEYSMKHDFLTDIPLYRTIPNFDSCFCEGEACPICNYLDQEGKNDPKGSNSRRSKRNTRNGKKSSRRK